MNTQNKKAMRRIVRNLDKYANMVAGTCGFDDAVMKAAEQRAKLIYMIECELESRPMPIALNPQK